MSDVLRPTSCRFGAAETKPQVRRLPDPINHQAEPQKDTPDPAQRITPSPTRSHRGNHHSQRQRKPQKGPLCSDGNARPSAAAAAAAPRAALHPQESGTGVGSSVSMEQDKLEATFTRKIERSPKPSFPAPFLRTQLCFHRQNFVEKKILILKI